MSSNNELSSQTSSVRTRFARRFLKSLLRLRKNGPTSSLSLKNIRGRSQRIKIASYSSMALAVGSKRAWSRAFILKIRNRVVRNHGLVARRRRCPYGNRSVRRSSYHQQGGVVKKKKVVGGEKKPSIRDHQPISQFDKLRDLIPGGDKMDLCNLLEETAHYIKCLDTQVKVMGKMADASPT